MKLMKISKTVRDVKYEIKYIKYQFCYILDRDILHFLCYIFIFHLFYLNYYDVLLYKNYILLLLIITFVTKYLKQNIILL